MSEAYLYSVHPKRVIKTLKDVPAIRTPKSLYLEIEDVKECIKYGAVYRRFANEGRNERVTVSSIERLHNAKFISEEEWNAGNRGTVVDTRVVEETPVVKEEVVEEAPVVEEKVAEPVIEEPVAEEVVEVPVVEETTVEDEITEEVEETVEEVVAEEEKVENNNQKYNNNKNYEGKNKRHH